MKNLNRVTFIGQLAVDPQEKILASGIPMTLMRMATNYSWKNAEGEWNTGVDYHTVVAWNSLATQIAALYKKGARVFVEGKLRTRSWKAADGETKFSTEVVAKSVLPMNSVAAKEKTSTLEDDTVETEEAWDQTPTVEQVNEPAMVA